MLVNFKEFWYLWIVFFIAVIVMVIVWRKAIIALTKRRRAFTAEMAFASNMGEKMKKYEVLTEEVLLSLPDNMIFEAVVANILSKYSKFEGGDIEKFNQLNLKQKYVCAVWYLFEDIKMDGLERFYRGNGDELTSIISDAFREVGEYKIANILEKVYKMFDVNCIEASYDEKVIKNAEIDYKNLIKELDIDKISSTYIKKNKAYFID